MVIRQVQVSQLHITVFSTALMTLIKVHEDTTSKQPREKQKLKIKSLVGGCGFVKIMDGSPFSSNGNYFQNSVIILPRF